jgi:hypothetical protein
MRIEAGVDFPEGLVIRLVVPEKVCPKRDVGTWQK